MKLCRICGAPMEDEAVFCTNCGALLEENLEETSLLYENEEMNTTVLDEDIEEIPPVGEFNPLVDSEPVKEINQDPVPPQYVNPAFNQQPAQPVYQYQQPQVQPKQNYYNSVQPQTNAGVPNNMFGDKMSYDEFYGKFASKKTRNNAKTVGIICIITAVVSLGILGMTMNPLSAIDVIFYGVFAGLVLKKKKWVFTLPVCIYGGVFTIIGLAMSGTPSGIFAFIMSIIATISLKRVEDAHKQYFATNQLPQNEI